MAQYFDCPLFLDVMTGLQTFLRIGSHSALLSLLVLCGGCAEISSLVGLKIESPKTELTLQVEPAGSPGVYTVSGQTNLPNQTRLTIQAIRNLKAASNTAQGSKPTYVILARSQAEVVNGKWQTTLNVLQKTPDGQVAESWQQSDRIRKLNLQPENRVLISAVTEPSNSAFEIRQRSENSTQESLSVRFTEDGRSYLQAEQSLNSEIPNPKLASQKTGSNIKAVMAKPLNKKTDSKPQIDTALSPKEWMR